MSVSTSTSSAPLSPSLPAIDSTLTTSTISWTTPTKFRVLELLTEVRFMEFLMNQADDASMSHLRKLNADYPSLELVRKMTDIARFVRTAHIQLDPKSSPSSLTRRSWLDHFQHTFETRLVKIGKSSLTWHIRMFIIENAINDNNDNSSNPDHDDGQKLTLVASLEIATVFVKRTWVPELKIWTAKSTEGPYQHPDFISPEVIEFNLPKAHLISKTPTAKQGRPKTAFKIPLKARGSDMAINHVVNSRLACWHHDMVLEGLSTGKYLINNHHMKSLKVNEEKNLAEIKIFFDDEVLPALGELTGWSWIEENNNEKDSNGKPLYTVQSQICFNDLKTGQEKVACWSRFLVAVKEDGELAIVKSLL